MIISQVKIHLHERFVDKNASFIMTEDLLALAPWAVGPVRPDDGKTICPILGKSSQNS
jgi:hypothetical protein